MGALKFYFLKDSLKKRGAKMNAVGKCVTGNKRKNNEDAILIFEGEGVLKNLYIVADGMGGHNAGEVASNSAIDAFMEYLSLHTKNHSSEEDMLDLIVGGIQYSNSAVYERAVAEEALSGMGTTFLTAVINQNTVYIGHVGDSRLYLFRNHELIQITKDHSFVMELVKQGKMTLEEAAVHPGRNIITRALGTAAKVDIDTIIERFEFGDIILMCSDGLSTMVDEDGMKSVLQQEIELQHKAEMLVKQADDNGGLDNISIILIQNDSEC